MEVTFYTLIIDCGDGSAYTEVYHTREEAEAAGQANFELLGEGYGDTCIDKHTLEV